MTVTAVTVQCPIENASVTAVVHGLTCNGRESVTAVTDIPQYRSYARMRMRVAAHMQTTVTAVTVQPISAGQVLNRSSDRSGTVQMTERRVTDGDGS
ncbi:hypothetical protein ACI3K4_27800 [Streptomyces sp. CSMPJR101]|uniref:hypothetical protein n=1 Tax=Streptomyces sp. CSMPJR101 TaxID=1279378 RepID=UPI003853502C